MAWRWGWRRARTLSWSAVLRPTFLAHLFLLMKLFIPENPLHGQHGMSCST